MRQLCSLMVGFLLLAACATTPPGTSEQADICDIFDNRKAWYRAAARAEDKWGVPIEVQLAIIAQESSFRPKARPPRGRRRFFGLVRGERPSTARGYTQALDGTWDEYKSATGRSGAKRSSFPNSVDFVGWYVDRAARRTGLPRSNARAQYLAYHEGPGGYLQGRWRSDAQLISIANTVRARAGRYQDQLDGCEKRLKRRGFLFF